MEKANKGKEIFIVYKNNVVCIIEIWQPFSSQMDLYEAWRIYHDSLQETWVNVSISEIEYPDIVQMCLEYGRMVYVYQGIVAGDLAVYNSSDERAVAMFLMGDMQKPMVEISRSKVSGLSLTTLLAINGILSKYQMLGILEREWRELEGWSNRTLKEWKKIEDSQLDIWLLKNAVQLSRYYQRQFQQIVNCLCESSRMADTDQRHRFLLIKDRILKELSRF